MDDVTTDDPVAAYNAAVAHAQAERPLQRLAEQARAAADREAAAYDDDTMAGVARALRIVPPVPGTTEAELLRAWAESVLPLVQQQQDQAELVRRQAVPFWTVQPNRTRRRR